MVHSLWTIVLTVSSVKNLKLMNENYNSTLDFTEEEYLDELFGQIIFNL